MRAYVYRPTHDVGPIFTTRWDSKIQMPLDSALLIIIIIIIITTNIFTIIIRIIIIIFIINIHYDIR